MEQWNNRSLLDPIASKTTAQRLEHGLLVAGLSGDTQRAFANDPQADAFFRDRPLTRDNMLEHIGSRDDLNREEASALLQQVDILSEGMNLMQHPTVQNSQQILSQQLQVLDQSLAASQQGFAGISITATARLHYQDRIIEGVMAHLDDHGTMPPSHVMSRLSREALDETMRNVQQQAAMPGFGQAVSTPV